MDKWVPWSVGKLIKVGRVETVYMLYFCLIADVFSCFYRQFIKIAKVILISRV